ncbi:hypothetical protein KAI68_08615, partial [bacterium]|nr:hypothetical protein [bacterium]
IETVVEKEGKYFLSYIKIKEESKKVKTPKFISGLASLFMLLGIILPPEKKQVEKIKLDTYLKNASSDKLEMLELIARIAGGYKRGMLYRNSLYSKASDFTRAITLLDELILLEVLIVPHGSKMQYKFNPEMKEYFADKVNQLFFQDRVDKLIRETDIAEPESVFRAVMAVMEKVENVKKVYKALNYIFENYKFKKGEGFKTILINRKTGKELSSAQIHSLISPEKNNYPFNKLSENSPLRQLLMHILNKTGILGDLGGLPVRMSALPESGDYTISAISPDGERGVDEWVKNNFRVEGIYEPGRNVFDKLVLKRVGNEEGTTVYSHKSLDFEIVVLKG